jgi:hypothetical protein
MIFGFNTDVKVAGTVYHVQSEARKKELLLQTQVFVKGRCIGKHASSYADKVSDPGFSDEHMHDLLKEQHKHIVELVRQGQVESALDAVSAHAAPAEAAPAPAAPPEAAAATAAAASSLEELFPPEPVAAAPATAPAATSLEELFPPEPTAPSRTVILAPLGVPPAAATPAGTPVALEPVGAAASKGLVLEWIPTDAVFADGTLMLKLQVLTEDGQAVPEAQLTSRLSVGQAPPAYTYATTDAGGNAELRTAVAAADLPECTLLIQASFRGKSASRRLRVRLHS